MIHQFKEGDVGVLTTLNEMFESLRGYFLFTRNVTLSGGVTVYINGGDYRGATVADVSLTLPLNTTSYVEANVTTGAITSNTTGFTSGRWAIGKAITNAEAVTSWQQFFTVGAVPTP